MGTTPVYHFPYPEPPDAADGPFVVETLARAIETEVARIWANARDADYVMMQRPMLRRRRTGSLTVANNTDTVIAFDATDVNTLGSPRPAAWYLIVWGITFDPNATGSRASYLRINGLPHPAGIADPPSLGTASFISNCKGRLLLVYLNPSDVVEVAGFQNSGGPLAIRTSPQADQAHLDIIHVAGPMPAGFPP
jgi:hypothetical protein